MLRFVLIFLISPICLLADTLSFSNDFSGWQGDFADYPVGEEKFYELSWGIEELPTPIFGNNQLRQGLFLQGNNHSDDLFMFAKRAFQVKPNKKYLLQFSILLESNIPTGSFGIGGSPGESVYFKVGAAPIEPKKVAKDGFYSLNLDKGNQGQGGKFAFVIGDLANENVDPARPRYASKELHSQKFLVEPGRDGKLWVFVGTDSGFEGFTKYYIARIILKIEAVQ
jgi:hypothetical protein